MFGIARQLFIACFLVFLTCCYLHYMLYALLFFMASLFLSASFYWGACRVTANIAAVRLATESHSNVQKLKIQQRMQRKQSLEKVGLLQKFLMVLPYLRKCHMLLDSPLIHNQIEDQPTTLHLQIIVPRLTSLIEAV